VAVPDFREVSSQVKYHSSQRYLHVGVGINSTIGIMIIIITEAPPVQRFFIRAFQPLKDHYKT